MSEPKIAARTPVEVDLGPGIYFWCACGRSQNQPYCDGSHRGTAYTPVQFEVREKQKLFLCRCKHTKTSPRCDGTHTTLPKE